MNKLSEKSDSDSTNGHARSRTKSSGPLATNLVIPSARSFEEPKHVSRTMKMALASNTSVMTALASSSLPDGSTINTSDPFVRYPPRSYSEQYWAVRALTAETLLAANKEHRQEVRTVTFVQETRRKTEVAQSNKMNDERLTKLERFLVILLGFLLLFALFIPISYISLAHSQSGTGRRGQWAHFTIPILSPFASVVEYESSIIGSKTMICVCLIVAGLAYFLFRSWISRNGIRWG